MSSCWTEGVGIGAAWGSTFVSTCGCAGGSSRQLWVGEGRKGMGSTASQQQRQNRILQEERRGTPGLDT